MGTFNLYLTKEDKALFAEATEFLKKYKIGVGRLIMVCFHACWPTVKKELPKKRSFVLNGEEIIP